MARYESSQPSQHSLLLMWVHRAQTIPTAFSLSLGRVRVTASCLARIAQSDTQRSYSSVAPDIRENASLVPRPFPPQVFDSLQFCILPGNEARRMLL